MYPVQTYFEYNGNLDAKEMVQIVARVEGFLNEIKFREGDDVKEGDLLFEIDPREFAATKKRAEADRLKAVAEQKRAQADVDRVNGIVGTGAISKEDYAQRLAAKETADAVVQQAEAAIETADLQLSYTRIVAPINGQISRTNVTRGNLVGQNGGNTVLTTIVSMDPLYVWFDAPEKDLIEYQRSLKENPGNEVVSGVFRVEVGVATEEGYPHIGKIDFRENRVDLGTGTVRIRGTIPNPRVSPADARLLYPGLFARVRVPSGAPRPLIAIPEDALMTGQEGRFVYVVGAENKIEKRTVVLGPQIAKGVPKKPEEAWKLSATKANPDIPKEALAADGLDQVEKPAPSIVSIVSGLSPDDVVVINGLTKARPGFPVRPLERDLIAPPAAVTAAK